MQKFPRDRFDSIPHGMDRVGAHRAPARRGRRWVTFAWAALATVVLAGIGIAAVAAYNQRLDFDDTALPTGTASPGPTAEPTLAPDVSVAVLNGTSTSGLAARAGETLTAAGVPVGITTNADRSDIEQTVVYYASADLEGAARGVAQQLPEAEVRLSEEFGEEGMQLVVVLGADYAEAVAG
ncbi:LytR C-terminal domain-containing protein [Agromyces sp. ZXT2-3]|uniref:LytR C-terminal domain-containing protein n=1 Tax=Agromyces sp. ZXT2-3 TaxID=3461152 RepID=UPI00405533A2